MDILNIFISIVFVSAAFIFCYMSVHLVEEKKQKKRIPLPWESGGYFDKSKVKTTDGDNT